MLRKRSRASTRAALESRSHGGEAGLSTARSSERGLVAAVALAVLYAGAFAALAILRHLALHSNAYDLGLEHQVTWNTAYGRPFACTFLIGLRPGLESHLGDHVNLILWPIAWLYHLWDGPETLLVVQAALVASGVVPLFLVARDLTGRPGPSLILASLYLLHPATQAALLFDFHPLVLVAPLLLWAYLFAVRRRWAWLALAALLILASQENAALIAALLGALLVLRGERAAGVALLVAGVAWFLVCFFVVLPAFRPPGTTNAFDRYRHLGGSSAEVALHLVRHPGTLRDVLLDPTTHAYLRGLAAPLGYLCLLAPEILIAAASELALNLLSSFAPQRTIDYQYSSVIAAAAALAAVVGTARVARLLDRAGAQRGLVGVSGAAIWGLTLWALVSTLTFQWRAYGHLRVLGREYAGVFTRTEHARLADRFLRRIPPDAPVSAQSNVAPHLAARPRIYVFPTVRDAEWVLLDRTASVFPVHLQPIAGLTPEEAYREYVRRLLEGGGYEVVDEEDGWLLLRRRAG